MKYPIAALILIIILLHQNPIPALAKKKKSPPPPRRSLSPPPRSPPPPPPHDPSPPPPVSLDYDHLELVLSWGPGYCKGGNADCIANPLPLFYVHGLWPAMGDDLRTECDGYKYSKGADVKLTFRDKQEQSKLERLWTSLNRHWTSWDLMAHEWNVHGRCSAPSLGMSIKMYLGTVDTFMLKLGNLAATMETAGVEPGPNLHSKASIEQAVKTKIGSKNEVRINCITVGGQVYLKELRVCIDPYGKQFDKCQVGRARGCPDQGILIPI